MNDRKMRRDKSISINHLDMMDRLGPYPSEADSDPWSDLTREFSERKLRKRSEFRTSTPNIDTAQSSSISSKEVGLIRKQLNG